MSEYAHLLTTFCCRGCDERAHQVAALLNGAKLCRSCAGHCIESPAFRRDTERRIADVLGETFVRVLSEDLGTSRDALAAALMSVPPPVQQFDFRIDAALRLPPGSYAAAFGRLMAKARRYRDL